MNLTSYRKTIVAALGLLAVVLSQVANVDQGWVDPLLAALTAAGVFGVANAPAPVSS